MTERDRLLKALQKAQAASDKAAAARAALPPGSSRARVTTANARWMRAAEERDRVQAALDALPVVATMGENYLVLPAGAVIHQPTTPCGPCGGGACKVFGSQAGPARLNARR